ncbi:malto-oligosyltrehalose trehalohydrolase [Jannaschia ovalis]|uniref:Malto-oligosyltrehalose trehalohydrolase n=1 Tax=Jannaschia ovalis TaxID=3038773 RepID=A0ABY8L9W8_9RHOB|nr:malto-oligosyltrehalose trehalohydrolase [Jannaschia sp. GRR-S6-38]WGH77163.1 malto-oligosyltrehalose trehalohydrolase [Jannaschia sp. GRR-S6-38]
MTEVPPPAWGALPGPDGTRFRIWAPGVETLTLVLPDRELAMDPAGAGWFERVTDAPAGTEYGFRLPDGFVVPDPAARRQAGDVHGRSVVTGTDYGWRHPRPERAWREAVIYECHIGTFTPEGTFRAAIDRLPHLAGLGVTHLEILPVAQFGGDRGWGYDGVLPYAPHPAYGRPDEMRALIDAAHGHGLMVLLDVVYNHFGPDGNYLGMYAPDFFDADRHTPWGAGIDYTRDAVRRFFIDNAVYWVTEFNLDGLRLDAIDQIRDPSDPELLVQLAREVQAAAGRPVHLTTEDNRNVTHLHEGAAAMQGEWNDDWHNAAHVLLTGETEGYYDAYAADPTGLLTRAMAEGFSTGGAGGKGVRSAHMQPETFIDFLQNHDQVGNRARGERLTVLADRDALRAMQAVLLLQPHVPMIFMGDEWEEERPFLFFADFDGDLGRAVTEGRRKEFEGFAGFSAAEVPDPVARATFEASRIDWTRAETPEGRAAVERHRALLRLRAERIGPLLDGTGPGAGRVLDAPARCLAVDWALGGGTVSIRANLSEAAVDLPAADGEMIHLEGAAPGAPNSAAVFVS